MQQGEVFYAVRKEEIDKLGNDSGLTGRDRQKLVSFGEYLRYLDCNMQERIILPYLEQLDIAIDCLQEHQREKSHFYTSPGTMAGLSLATVLCQEEEGMGVNLIFKITAAGILIPVVCQILRYNGRGEQAFLISLAGLILVLFWAVSYIYDLFKTIKSLFILQE